MGEVVQFEKVAQEEMRQDLRSVFLGAIRLSLELLLEEELKAMVGARRYERIGSRKDHRNGTYLRRLLTSLGQLEVAVPRGREVLVVPPRSSGAIADGLRTSTR